MWRRVRLLHVLYPVAHNATKIQKNNEKTKPYNAMSTTNAFVYPTAPNATKGSKEHYDKTTQRDE